MVLAPHKQIIDLFFEFLIDLAEIMLEMAVFIASWQLTL